MAGGSKGGPLKYIPSVSKVYWQLVGATSAKPVSDHPVSLGNAFMERMIRMGFFSVL